MAAQYEYITEDEYFQIPSLQVTMKEGGQYIRRLWIQTCTTTIVMLHTFVFVGLRHEISLALCQGWQWWSL